MASFKTLLQSIFGWESSRPPRVATRTSTGTAIEQPINPSESIAERYHDELSYRKSVRRDRYDVYDAMDEMCDVASVLDAYAEDATQVDRRHEAVVWVEAKDKKIRTTLSKLFQDVGVEDWIEANVRDTGKYGDDFMRVHGKPGTGITSVEWTDPKDVERIENKEGILVGYEHTSRLGTYKQKLQDNPNSMPSFKPWDFVHFRLYRQKRLPGHKNRNIYGTSLLYASDRIAKQVKILDDLLMIVRLTKSLDRRIYYVDVGRSPVEEEVRILKRWRRALKRKTYIDPASSRFDSRFDPHAWTEDEFWPTKENTNSRVETISGLGSVGEQVDIEHFRDKFFGSLRAPKAYFGYEGDVNAKATLSSQSLKWGRAVESLQRAVRTGLTRLCQIHLAWKGMDPSTENFTVMMVPPSILELLDRLEGWQTVVDVAERMMGLADTMSLDKYDWTIYVLENVLWLSKEEVKKFVKKLPKEPEPPPEEPPSEPEPPPEEPPDEPPPPEKPEEPEKPETERLEEIDRAITMALSRRKVPGASPSELPPVIESDDKSGGTEGS